MAGIGADEQAGAADATVSAITWLPQFHSSNDMDHATDEHLGWSAPLAATFASQQHDSTSCVVIKEVSKSAQKIGTADRYMPDGKENAVEAARLLPGQWNSSLRHHRFCMNTKKTGSVDHVVSCQSVPWSKRMLQVLI